jgi:hypothetical protein
MAFEDSIEISFTILFFFSKINELICIVIGGGKMMSPMEHDLKSQLKDNLATKTFETHAIQTRRHYVHSIHWFTASRPLRSLRERRQ